MKAIQTRYNGYLFRSRLEARWAVFFKSLGMKWEYEPEGFDLGDGVYYLPDFRVTSPQGLISWYEVKRKGHPPCEKMKRFGHHHAEMTRLFGDCGRAYTFLTLAGDPTDVFFNDQHLHVCCRCGSFTKNCQEMNAVQTRCHLRVGLATWIHRAEGSTQLKVECLDWCGQKKGSLSLDVSMCLIFTKRS